MAVHFHVLASGSSGNASLLDVEGFGILIDVGLGPRQLAGRCRDEPPLWDRVHAALLTHVHGDHWNENTFNQLARRGVPLYCHPEHAHDLGQVSPAFGAMAAAGLVQHYAIDRSFGLGPGCRVEAFSVKHDGGITCGFRIEGPTDLPGHAWALAYAADLGSWDLALASRFADVDVLALEFNHDVAMQYASGRSPHLIRRVLGDHGHLSNHQAAALFAEVLRRSAPGRVQHLVQLHLSRQCNTPELARHAADAVVRQSAARVAVHTSSQEVAGPRLCMKALAVRAPVRRRRGAAVQVQAPTLFADWE
jgi:phosphoribosyl 1,2-cyclic phosphodiesterase